MSPKWPFLAHFGDIPYNVFNRRISLIFQVETSYSSNPIIQVLVLQSIHLIGCEVRMYVLWFGLLLQPLFVLDLT